MSSPPDEYNFESEMAGLYGGGVLGGLLLGAFGDLIQSEIHSMAWYITGTVVGAVAGAIAGMLFRRFVQDAPPDEEPSPT